MELWWALVNAVTNLWVSQKVGIWLAERTVNLLKDSVPYIYLVTAYLISVQSECLKTSWFN